ncbi:MAG: NAD(P)H-hydrate epimerase [Caldilinea sp.]|jgi:NAD(P)H-hydrate epimerase|nr:NAD(P)H-hydrate epimerase [Caldilinea sp.]
MDRRVQVPTLSTSQVQEVERLLVERFAFDPLQWLENTGQQLARLARRLLEGNVTDRPIVVLAGRGTNGGGGLAAARHLLNWGAWVQIVCSYPTDSYRGAPARQLQILQAMGAPLAWAEEGWELPPADLLIDAVIGYGLRGDPRGPARALLQLANSSAAPILSLDTPSGVDTEQGRLFTPHLQAAATLTLGLPKTGFRQPAAAKACGDLYLADIGVPPELYSLVGVDVPPLFGQETLIPLSAAAGSLWA